MIANKIKNVFVKENVLEIVEQDNTIRIQVEIIHRKIEQYLTILLNFDDVEEIEYTEIEDLDDFYEITLKLW